MQIHRLFEITHILLNKGTVTASELAARFEVSVRTVYRDVEALSEAGVPVYMNRGRGGGIRLTSGYVLNKAVLSPEEKRELLAALQGFTAVGAGETAAALSKLGALFGTAAGTADNWIEIDFSSWYNQEETSRLFALIKQAILGRRTVSFTYYGMRGGRTERTVEPLRLVYRGYAWYVFAFCRLRGQPRFFKLTRMAGVILQDETFERVWTQPVLTAENYMKDARYERLKLKIDKAAAFRVYEEFERDNVSTDEDGNFIVTCDFPADDGWLFGYVVSFAGLAAVLEPPAARDLIRQTLRGMLGAYE